MKNHGQRGDLEAVSMFAQERTQRGGHDIGATADCLGEDHIGLEFEEAIGGVHQIGKAAAKASAGNLIAIHAQGGGVVGIDQVAALVVEDGGGTQSALLK